MITVASYATFTKFSVRNVTVFLGCPEIGRGMWIMLFTSVLHSDAKHKHVFGMLVLRFSGLEFSIWFLRHFFSLPHLILALGLWNIFHCIFFISRLIAETFLNSPFRAAISWKHFSSSLSINHVVGHCWIAPSSCGSSNHLPWALPFCLNGRSNYFNPFSLKNKH